MIEWSKLTGFEWDFGNERKSVDKHDVSEAEAEQLFFNEPLLMLYDQSHSDAEVRIHALGKTDTGRLLHITFTMRQKHTKIRVISARTMSRKERSNYDKQS